AGFLLLLSADSGDRIRSWGHVLAATPSGTRAVRAPSADAVQGLARGGRRVGAAALVLAAVVPTLVPGLGDRLLTSGGEGPGAGNGSGRTIRAINPILSLHEDLTRGDATPLLVY